ncbi:recombinase family protein [Intestinibacillus massiliensis]|nr:recombinase family protein [Intestinibacillus massiliensis]
MTGALRVAAYCRVSTDSGDQQNSLKNQVQYFESRIAQNPGWELVGIFADEGITGTSTRRRKQFNAMIQRAEQGGIDLILTKEVSRFARNTMDALAYTRRLKEIGVGVLFLSDNIDTRDNDGEFRLTIMASVAQEESRKTSQRVRWGQKRSMERGVVFGNDTLYGYETRGGALAVRADEAATVRWIYHQCTDEGKGTHVIARELQEAGVPTPRGGAQWSPATVRRILMNEKYCGDLLQKKYITPDFLSHKKVPNRGQEEQVYLPAHHEAIISRERFVQAQAVLAQRAGAAGRYSGRYWCSGKVRCGLCGGAFVPRRAVRSDGMPYVLWCCAARRRGQGCAAPAVNQKVLAGCVRYALEQLGFGRQGLVAALAARLAAPDGEEDAAGRQAAGLLHAKHGKALDAFLRGDITAGELAQVRARYDAALAMLGDGKPAPAQDAAEWGRAAERALAQADEVLAAAAEQLTVQPGWLEVQFYGIPARFALEYRTKGKGKTYGAEILSCQAVRLDGG